MLKLIWHSQGCTVPLDLPEAPQQLANIATCPRQNFVDPRSFQCKPQTEIIIASMASPTRAVPCTNLLGPMALGRKKTHIFTAYPLEQSGETSLNQRNPVCQNVMLEPLTYEKQQNGEWSDVVC